MKKNSKSPVKKEQKAKRAKVQRPVQREPKEVLAELVEKLQGKLELKATSASPAEAGPRAELSPNLDRLTVGVDLGDRWSNFCILGLQGEMLSEGKLQTREAEVAEFFQALPPARVVMEVGTHSPWMQEIIAGEGHEVLVANPRLMEGSKRRKRKNDRIDANELAPGNWATESCQARISSGVRGCRVSAGRANSCAKLVASWQPGAGAFQAQARRRVLMEHGQLVTKGENLGLQDGASPKTGGEKSEESNQNRVHRGCNHHLTNDGKPPHFQIGRSFLYAQVGGLFQECGKGGNGQIGGVGTQ